MLPSSGELVELRRLLEQQGERIRQLEERLGRRVSEMPARGLSDRAAATTKADINGNLSHVAPAAFLRSTAGDPTAYDAAGGALGSSDFTAWPTFELGGQYRVMFNAANFGFHPLTISDAQRSQSFFNQRLRNWLTVQTSEHVAGYVQTEIGHVGFGDDLEFPKAFIGPRFPPGNSPDRVGIELRRGYLTYESDGAGRWRVGIQDWSDSFDDTLASANWDFNVGGLSWLTNVSVLGDMRLLAGAFVLMEGELDQADDAVLYTIDGDWHDDGGAALGWSVYVLSDHGGYSYPTAAAYDLAWDVWLGVRATLPTALSPLHLFFILNTGRRNELGGAPDFEHTGYALKLSTGPIDAGLGRLQFQTLYSTGEGNPASRDSGEFRTVAQSLRDNFGAQGYWSYLNLTSPNAPGDVNDLGVSLQNRGLGLFTVQAALDYDLYKDQADERSLSGTLAAGWLHSDAPNPTSGSRNMGTELANTFSLYLGGGLIIDIGAAVLWTGDFYRSAGGSSPDTLWEVFSRVQLEF